MSEGLIEISGDSTSINPHEFFQPIMEWLEEYSKAPKPQTNVKINFKIFNTGTARCLAGVFLILQNIYKINQGVTINWLYDIEDEGMLETGYNFETIAKIPFEMIGIQHVDQENNVFANQETQCFCKPRT